MPVLPVHAPAAGIHTATIEGFTFRPSSRDNPMVEVDITLDTGELSTLYLMVTYDGRSYQAFFQTLGLLDIVKALRAKKIPEFELDDLIGKTIEVNIFQSGIVALSWRYLSRGYPYVY